MGWGLRYRQDRSLSGPVLTVSGRLSRRTRGRLLTKMHTLAASGQGPLTVDISRVSYFDSVSLTILLGTERVIERQLDCPVDIRGIDVATSRLTGLDTLAPLG